MTARLSQSDPYNISFLSDLPIFRRFSVILHFMSLAAQFSLDACALFMTLLMLHHFYHVSCCTPSVLFISALRFV